MTTTDVLIVGGGMAGAAAGWHLARDGIGVTLLEREDQPGYHSTGRSAALFSETYGPTPIRRLSTASRPFLEDPPAGFSEHPLLTPRGLLVLTGEGEQATMATHLQETRANGADVQELDADAIRDIVPILRPGIFTRGALEAAAMDIDVAALHQGFLRGLKQAGGGIAVRAEVEAIRHAEGQWQVTLRGGETHAAPVLINAAGAWADEIAALAGVRRIGLVAKRRTALTLDLPAGTDAGHWPMTGDLAETFYFKPDAGRLLLSPADATPVPPQDVQPEIEDVAGVIDRFMQVTTVEVERPGETWAGLRSFVSDGSPVVGYEPDVPGFFWLAGQGGYGIQTAAALGAMTSELVAGRDLPALYPRAELAPDRDGLERPSA